MPNSKAFWCSRCTAHNPYKEEYMCKACGFPMFRPAETLPWVYGFSILTILLVLLGCFPASPGFTRAVFGFAAAFGLMSGVGIYCQRRWVNWSSASKRKSPKQIEHEALNHPFQPEYEQDGDFTGWARQFLSEEEVDLLHQTYGDKKAELK